MLINLILQNVIEFEAIAEGPRMEVLSGGVW